MVVVKLINLTKVFGKEVAVDNVNLEIEHGCFFTLLGPSGSGKSTTLRMIAGLEEPTKGEVMFDGKPVTHLPPYKRGVGMVFQNYALWPFMTVFDNVAFGLKIRKLPKEEIKKRVREALRLVQLEGMEKKYPHQLSGGQQQRVALARALVVNPKILLLDEPLSNLDAKLRIEMRREIRKLQKSLGITTIYVTHDQEEALAISDRIAVMNHGKVIATGTPYDVYVNCPDEFILSFVGHTNFIEGKVKRVLKDGRVLVETPLGDLTLMNAEGMPKKTYLLGFRPEYAKLTKKRTRPNAHEAKVVVKEFLGKFTRYEVKVDGQTIVVDLMAKDDPGYAEGDGVYVDVDEDHVMVIRG
ncbi:MAG TPA: ABC transporter ATP-binding protein [Nitrososphaeria archaeon]|nr:ABC transporter ATP-binding protein [Nitrososphaeria archaeon]